MSPTIPPSTTTSNHRTPCPPPSSTSAQPPPSHPAPPRRNSSNGQSSVAEQPQRRMADGGSDEVSPGGRGRGGHEDRRSAQAESSGDEITPLASRERGNASGRNYSSTGTKGGDTAGEERLVDTGTGEAGKRRGRRRDAGGGGDGDGKEEEGWWTRVVEKFGSVELDNKGSVARDHLALGMLRSLHCMSTAFVSSSSSPHPLRSLSLLPILPHPSHIHFLSLCLPHPPPYQRLTRQRTYLPSLAPYLPLLRRHRHRHHPALPPQHHHPTTRRLHPIQPAKYIPSASAGQAVGRYVLGDRDHGAGGWGKTVFREPGMPLLHPTLI